MHGPGGPGAPGGPGGRPPRHRFFGGSIFGPGGRAWGPGFKMPGPIPHAYGGDTSSNGATYSERSAKKWAKSYVNKRTIQNNTGSKVKGIILGSRLNMTGPLHEGLYVSRIKSVDNLLAEKRITAEVAKYRKLKANFAYNSYLLKCELLTDVEFIEAMKSFAGQIGAVGEDSYILEQVLEENGIDLAEYEAEKAKSK